eukprot:COSAG04_NODE_2357_length_4278_cov_3.159608_4_plen_329_part_01
MTPLKLELPSGELRRGRLTDQTYAALLDAASDSGLDSPRTALHFVDDEGDSCRLTTDAEVEEACRLAGGKALRVIVTEDPAGAAGQPQALDGARAGAQQRVSTRLAGLAQLLGDEDRMLSPASDGAEPEPELEPEPEPEPEAEPELEPEPEPEPEAEPEEHEPEPEPEQEQEQEPDGEEPKPEHRGRDLSPPACVVDGSEDNVVVQNGGMSMFIPFEGTPPPKRGDRKQRGGRAGRGSRGEAPDGSPVQQRKATTPRGGRRKAAAKGSRRAALPASARTRPKAKASRRSSANGAGAGGGRAGGGAAAGGGERLRKERPQGGRVGAGDAQ